MEKRRCNRIAIRRQRGAVLITVMVVMMVSMMLVSVLINQYTVTEARAIEQLLAETRLYWAMDGHVNLVLSRAAGATLCSGNCATNVARRDDINGSLRASTITWGSGNRAFSTIDTGTFGAVTLGASAPSSDSSGRLFFQVAVSNSGSQGSYWSDVFSTSPVRVNPLRVDFISSLQTSGANLITSVTRPTF